MAWTNFVTMGSITGAVAVILGAFGAHFMKSRYSVDQLAIFETGVKYQMYHALAIIAAGMVAAKIESTAIKVAGISFMVGTILFSGSLYLLVFLGNRQFGMITPIGGVALIAGWIALAVSVQ